MWRPRIGTMHALTNGWLENMATNYKWHVYKLSYWFYVYSSYLSKTIIACHWRMKFPRETDEPYAGE